MQLDLICYIWHRLLLPWWSPNHISMISMVYYYLRRNRSRHNNTHDMACLPGGQYWHFWVGVTKNPLICPLWIFSTVQIPRIKFIFDRCHWNSAATTPVKYEGDMQWLACDFTRLQTWENNGNWLVTHSCWYRSPTKSDLIFSPIQTKCLSRLMVTCFSDAESPFGFFCPRTAMP